MGRSDGQAAVSNGAMIRNHRASLVHDDSGIDEQYD